MSQTCSVTSLGQARAQNLRQVGQGSRGEGLRVSLQLGLCHRRRPALDGNSKTRKGFSFSFLGVEFSLWVLDGYVLVLAIEINLTVVDG